MTFLPKGEGIVLFYPLPTEEKINVMKPPFSLLLVFTCLIFEAPFKPLMGGGPPLVTDDTGTPGHKKWEINLAYTIRNTIHERATGFVVDANYGLGERSSNEPHLLGYIGIRLNF